MPVLETLPTTWAYCCVSELETKHGSHLHPAFFFGKIPCLLLGYKNVFKKVFKKTELLKQTRLLKRLLQPWLTHPITKKPLSLNFIPIETLSPGGRKAGGS